MRSRETVACVGIISPEEADEEEAGVGVTGRGDVCGSGPTVHD